MCESHDICTSCLESDAIGVQRCSVNKTSPISHCYAPIFDVACKHREDAPWTTGIDFVDHTTLHYSPWVDPDRFPTVSLPQRWHKDITDVRGWESEPDEGRRIKTRFARYHARKLVIESEIDNPRIRSRSLPPTKSSDISCQVWRDFVFEIDNDKGLWDLNYL